MNTYGNYTATELETVGGKTWNDRVYFNDLTALYGLTYNTYKSGNISSASLNSERISNSRARSLVNTFSFGKVWFNLTTQTFESKNINNSEIVDTLVGAIQKQIADIRTAQAIAAASKMVESVKVSRKNRSCKNNPAQMDMFSIFNM